MFGILFYDILFFAIPIILIAMFVTSLCLYISAKRKNKAVPGTFPDNVVRKRRIMFIASSVISGVFTLIVVGFIALLFMAVAYM